MRTAACILMVGFAVQPRCTEAQVSQMVESDGFDVVVTSWHPTGEASASVLLVPGWGGGPLDDPESPERCPITGWKFMY